MTGTVNTRAVGGVVERAAQHAGGYVASIDDVKLTPSAWHVRPPGDVQLAVNALQSGGG